MPRAGDDGAWDVAGHDADHAVSGDGPSLDVSRAKPDGPAADSSVKDKRDRRERGEGDWATGRSFILATSSARGPGGGHCLGVGSWRFVEQGSAALDSWPSFARAPWFVPLPLLLLLLFVLARLGFSFARESFARARLALAFVQDHPLVWLS